MSLAKHNTSSNNNINNTTLNKLFDEYNDSDSEDEDYVIESGYVLMCN